MATKEWKQTKLPRDGYYETSVPNLALQVAWEFRENSWGSDFEKVILGFFKKYEVEFDNLSDAEVAKGIADCIKTQMRANKFSNEFDWATGCARTVFDTAFTSQIVKVKGWMPGICKRVPDGTGYGYVTFTNEVCPRCEKMPLCSVDHHIGVLCANINGCGYWDGY